MESIKGKTAIVGVGVHQFSRDSGRTEWDMACRCIRDALDDAGLTPEDIDGIMVSAREEVEQQHIARALGIGNLPYFGDCGWEGAATCAQVLRAAIGVAAGMANNVIFVRSRNDSSAHRHPISYGELNSSEAIDLDFYEPFGHCSQAGRAAMLVRRYMHEYGIDAEDFGWVTAVCRENGAGNPNGLFYGKPLTIEDYRASEMVVDPLRALDCHENVDGAAACIITTAERAKRLRQAPVYILAGAQSMAEGAEMMTAYYRPQISRLDEIGNVGRKLFSAAAVGRKDIDVVQLEDAYAPLVPMQLEELGFCGRGEGAAFCAGGERIRPDGELPLNTSGGSLGEGHLYGMNHVLEAVHQLRGTSRAQKQGAALALVATGAGGPASGLILGRET
jgi:acetyl-CoA acetyltransferase